MRVNGFVVHGAVTAAVFASGVGAAIAGGGAGGVTLAGPQVLRLIQNAPAALSSYPSMKMTMKFTFSGGGQSRSFQETADISPDGKSGSFSLPLPNGGGTLSAVAVNHTLYMHASQQTVASYGKHWVGLSLTNGSQATPSQAPTGDDALSYLHLMPGATGDVQTLGHQTIDQVRTTHYRVTIDLAKAEQSMPPQLQQSSAAQLAQLGISTMPVDVWLDAQNKLRQEKVSMDVQHQHFDMLLRLSGSSTPINVTAPPASDVHFVATATELIHEAIQH